MKLGWTVVLALGACVEPIAEHESTIGEVVRDCVIAPPAGVAALEAPVSLEYADASLWIWPELAMTDGSRVAAAAARVTSADAACAGLTLVRDGGGRVASVLALDAAEEAENATRTDGKRLALVPTGGVVDGATGYLYYDHVLHGPGLLDAEVVGTGLCVLAPGATACERVAAGGSTRLWAPDARVLNRGGVIVDDGGVRRAVVAGCRRVASFEDPCVVAGAPVAALRDPAAYAVWNVFDGWVARLVDASAFADEPGAVTLAPYDDGFLATSLDLFDARVEVRRSTRVQDGYGHAMVAFDVVAPASWFPRGGREHAALRPEPRSIAVTYATDGAAAPGLHLVTFRFWGDFQ